VDPAGLFLVFLKAAALGLGGFGSLPVLREDLILAGNATDEQLVQALAVGRLSTGPNGTYVVSLGYFAGGLAGAVAALVAACLPPLVMVPAVALARRHLVSPAFAGFIRGASLATAGLLLAIALAILVPAAEGLSALRWWQVLLAAGAAAVTYRGRLHPALLIGAGAAAGLVLGR
jgi:chromate transporter